MKQHWTLCLGLTLCFACTPVTAEEEPGSGGNPGSGGSTKSGGSGGGQSASGGSGGSTNSGGSSGASGGSSGSSGGSSGSSGGASGSSGGSSGSSGGAGGSADAAPSGDTGGGAGGASGGGPAAALNDLVIKVPCPAATTGGSCNIATDVRAYDKPFMIAGDAATTYKVKLKICAVYEGRPYTGCMTSPDSPRICIDGMPGTGGFAPTYPTLGLKVAAPARTYYLNAGNDYADKILKFDYTATFEMKGGTMVNFISNGGTNGGVYTANQGGAKHMCPDVPGGLVQPFAGQFIHVKVVSIDPM